MPKAIVTEKELCRRIDVLNSDKEVQRVINNIEKATYSIGAYLVEWRIKSKNSAINSFKNNKVKAKVSQDLYLTVGMTNPSTVESFKCVDTVVDLLAMRVITKTPEDMYKIRDYLSSEYSPFIVIDGINNVLVGFEYRAIHMYFKLKIKGIEFEVPMEIQLKTYEMHHAWSGLHDTIYKNPKVNLYDGCNLLPTLFKIFEFNVKALNNAKTDFSAINCIIEYNKKLFDRYSKELRTACFLFAKSLYYDKYKNSSITENQLLKVFDKIVDCNNDIPDVPLHVYGNTKVEYATYCIIANNIEEYL
jgi:ppGpp synthetase/RelA/SpoT-type nucleotidyltranferase